MDVAPPAGNPSINYPQVECTQVEFDEMFTRRMLNRMDYSIFLQGIAAYRKGFQATLLRSVASPSERGNGNKIGGSDEDEGNSSLDLNSLIVSQEGDVQLTAHDVISMPLPKTLEELTDAISFSTASSARAEEDLYTMPSSGFTATDPQQQRLLLLLYTLLEGLALRNGTLCCSSCEASYPVEDFIPSFVTS